MFGQDALKVVEESQTLLINTQSKLMEQKGAKVIKFGFGQSPFPVEPSIVEELQKHAYRKDYAPVQGLPEVREAVAKYHKQVDGLDVDASRVFVAPGSKILIMNVMLSFKTLNVFVPAPAWVSYEPQAKLCGHPCVRVMAPGAAQLDWRMTADALDAAFANAPLPGAPKLLITTNPGNPTGQTFTEEQLRAIAGVCRKHKVIVISDEIYGLLHHDGKHRSLAAYYENTIISAGISKWCGAGGWRFGYVVFPPSLDFMKTVYIGVGSESYSCAPTHVQLAAAKAYELCPAVLKYVANQRRILRAVGHYVATRLRSVGIVTADPEGGFYLFVSFEKFAHRIRRRGITTSSKFFAHVHAKTGVAVLHGEAFGMPAYHFIARLAYVAFDGTKTLEAAAAVPEGEPLAPAFVEENCPDVVDGLRRLMAFARELDADAAKL